MPNAPLPAHSVLRNNCCTGSQTAVHHRCPSPMHAGSDQGNWPSPRYAESAEPVLSDLRRIEEKTISDFWNSQDCCPKLDKTAQTSLHHCTRKEKSEWRSSPTAGSPSNSTSPDFLLGCDLQIAAEPAGNRKPAGLRRNYKSICSYSTRFPQRNYVKSACCTLHTRNFKNIGKPNRRRGIYFTSTVRSPSYSMMWK